LYSQDDWLITIVRYLYEQLFDKATGDSSEFDDLTNQFPDYGFSICTNNSYACWSKLNQGQNFYTLITKLKIQGQTVDNKNLFQNGSSVSVELTSGSDYCPSITPDPTDFPIRSGVSNGVEILLDLETYDNGDLMVFGDGVDILITDAYLIFVTGASGGARVNFFWPV